MNRLSKFFINIGASLNGGADVNGLQTFYQYINDSNMSFDYTNLPKIVNEAYARSSDVYSIVSYIARNAASISWHVKEYFADMLSLTT